MRRKGELSPWALDRGWPHQVALMQIEAGQQFIRVGDIRRFCEKLSLAPRGHSFYRDGKFYDVYCFSDPEHAELFRKAFDGEKFDKAAHVKAQRALRGMVRQR